MMKPAYLHRAFLALLTCLVLAACSATEEGVPLPTGRIITAKPPEPLVEMKVFPDNPMTEVWRPGHWVYDDGDFEWVPGDMIARPSPTAAWSPDRWEQRAYGWAFIPGYWR